MHQELSDLALAERELIGELPGFVVQDHEVHSRITHKYAEIVNAYLMLAKSGNSEALKRLVFLWWIAPLEPIQLTGLNPFPADSSDKVVTLLNDERAALDEEFRKMLEWYHAITPWHFDGLDTEFRTELEARVNGPDGTDLSEIKLLEDRGQMGDYFRDMREGQERDRSS